MLGLKRALFLSINSAPQLNSYSTEKPALKEMKRV
jgi:hypothetical protein